MSPRPSRQRVGLVLLLAAAATVVLLPPSWLTIALASSAWLAFATDPRFGPLAAALVIVLALPYDRAADLGLIRVAGVPVRPHDVVIGLGLIASLPAIRSVRWTPGVRLLAVFLCIGVASLAWGVINNQDARDVLRDARWWGLYAGGLLLAGRTQSVAGLVRAAFIGLGVYALLVIATSILPAFEGALKANAIAFDVAALRMQFGPTPFLLIPIAYWAARMARFGHWWPDGGWLSLFVIGLALSLTRVTIAVLGIVLALVAAYAVWGAPRRWAPIRRGTLMIVTAVIALAVGFGINTAGVGVLDTGQAPNALTRLTLDPGMLLGSAADRFEGYSSAVSLIREAPLIGHGLGKLVPIDYEFGAGDFDTPGMLPNVDNAYLTIALKSGLVGVVAFAVLMLWPTWRLWAVASRRVRVFMLPAWLGLLALTMTQSFAVIGHSPFVLGLLIVAIDQCPRRPRIRTDGLPDPDERKASPHARIGRS